MFEDEASALVANATATWREEAILAAQRLDFVAELVEIRTVQAEEDDPDPGYMIITGLRRTTADIGAALNLNTDKAGEMVAHAVALRERLPRTRDLLAAGGTDWAAVELILNRTELVSDSAMAVVDTVLAERLGKWQCLSRRRLINAVDAAIRTHDPDAVRERERARDRRYVRVTPLRNGTARLDGVLANAAAAAFERRLSTLATGVCADDPRSMDQRRSDAISAWTDGRPLTCQCGRPDCAGPMATAGTRVVINVIAESGTLEGENDRPALIPGHGLIDADELRELAEQGAVRTLTEPMITPVEALRYQPSAALARWVRARDLTCRFPGCDRPAEVCDLDHTIEFNHADPAAGGRTCPSNIKCLCRQHHRLKTFDFGWRDEQLPDGTVVWTAPDGRIYRTSPLGADLFGAFTKPACGEPQPERRALSRAARRERARAKNRRLYPINKAARHYQFAYNQEIRHREQRNHMRRMLRVFKGDEPSRSPWDTYINDPIEDDEPPPGWQPPWRPPDPDDPPF